MAKALARRTLAFIFALVMLSAGTAYAYGTEMAAGVDFGDHGKKAYAYLAYIDRNLKDRDTLEGRDIDETRDWLVSELKASGYQDRQIERQDFSFTSEYGSGSAQNIIVTLPGKSDSQIIVGAHYDNVNEGSGADDNGSGVAVVLEAAHNLIQRGTLPQTVVFVFFDGEEYDLYGSAAYAEAMTRNEVKRTEYMVNIDSVLAVDFCYLYGGAADFTRELVTHTGAFEEAYALSEALGLGMRKNPWTYENPAPGYDEPEYPSPSTGDWSDHVAFRDLGIPYVYMEATNWDVPGSEETYDGTAETADFGEILHTRNDTLKKIEQLFPGRALYHLQVFSLLLYRMLAGE